MDTSKAPKWGRRRWWCDYEQAWSLDYQRACRGHQERGFKCRFKLRSFE